MNHWAFIVAAYALALGVTGALVLLSYLAMRRAERAVEALRRE